jgi:hypothetical protein
MKKAQWRRSVDPVLMLDFLGVRATDRKSRLFACACGRRVWPLLKDERSRLAVEVGEQYADGIADDGQLARAGRDAFEAQREIMTGVRDDAADMAACVACDACRENTDFRFPSVDNYTAATDAAHCTAAAVEYAAHAASRAPVAARKEEEKSLANVVRDIFGNPFRPVTFAAEWRTDTAVALARQMNESRDSSAMPILADALEDAGCANEDMLAHCRDTKQVHVRGCWVVDLVLSRG